MSSHLFSLIFLSVAGLGFPFFQFQSHNPWESRCLAGALVRTVDRDIGVAASLFTAVEYWCEETQKSYLKAPKIWAFLHVNLLANIFDNVFDLMVATLLACFNTAFYGGVQKKALWKEFDLYAYAILSSISACSCFCSLQCGCWEDGENGWLQHLVFLSPLMLYLYL